MSDTTLSIDPNSAVETRERRQSRLGRFGLAAIVAGLVAWGAIALIGKRAGGHKTGDLEAARTVPVIKAERADLSQYLTLSAEFHPYQEVSVHAKVAGYVQTIKVDIGDHVKAGQSLADLEIPELRDDLKKASAELLESREEVKRAEANYEESHLAYQRLLDVAKEHPKLVAQQDLDTAGAKDAAMQGALGAAQQRVDECEANKGKFRAMLDYASITAPFDGVITKRYADTGALVQAGTSSSTQAMPLVEIAQDDVLRLVFPVPESAVPLVHDGLPVKITMDSMHQKFAGTISRTAGKVERSTRTMEAEVDVPNPDGKFTPGMYATVKLPVEQRKNAVAVPLQALSRGENQTLFVLNKNGQLENRKVSVGLQTSTEAEITSGLQAGELVLVGSRMGLHPGQKATGKVMEAQAME